MSRLFGFVGATVLVLALWPTGILQSLFHTFITISAGLLGIASGIVLYLSYGKQRVIQTPRLSSKTEQVSRHFSKLTVNQVQKSYKHRTVVSRPIDKTIQEVFDFFIRDFCLSWFRNLGKDEAGFVDLLTEELWAISENVVERLVHVDTVKFLSKDVVDVLCTHFQKLRMADVRNFRDNAVPFVLHPCLASREAEQLYLSKYSEALLYCLLPAKNSRCTSLRYLLREILAFSVFQPLTDLLCDPDYIYQTLLLQLEAKQALAVQHKQGYAYADTYEDFIKMITACNSVEYLKQVRYHIIAEIMQATTINNLKGIESLGQGEGAKSLKKDAQLRSRNLKRYINQCTVAKGQCEKRIKLLGGPDYAASHSAETKPVGPEKSRGPHKQNTAPAKMLSFTEIMDNSLARNFFMQFLENHTTSKNVLRFWMAIENLKLANHMELHKSAQEIYQVYVTPSSDKSIMLDTTLVRGMEDYLNGTKGLQCYFDAQKKCYHSLEEKFYRKFVLSKEYFMFVCQAEAEMDDLRAQQGEEDDTLELNWNSADVDVPDEENWLQENKPGRKPSTVEERSDSIVNKLQVLDQRLASKTQQLELVRKCYGTDVEEMERIQGEMEKLITERRHLEFHIERTELWCENLGEWKIQIQSAQLSPEAEEKSVPLYVVVVHCAAESTTTAGAEGWVVTRKLKDFQSLHSKLKECCSWLSKELPLPSKKWYKSMDEAFLENSRQSLESYLQNLLADEKLSLSEELYSFLSPSPEHLKKQSEPAKKAGFSLKSVLKSLPFDIIANEEAEEEGVDQEDSAQRKDSIAEPFYALIGEVFELKGVFKWLRKTLIAFVQVTFGGNINKEIKQMVEWLVSEPMIIYYIHNFRDSMWPGGQLAEPAATRSAEQKLQTKEKAKKLLLKNIPEVLQNLVGKRNSKLGTIKVFETFQDIRVNKHLFYVLFELCIMRLCPEVCADDILQKAKLKSK